MHNSTISSDVSEASVEGQGQLSARDRVSAALVQEFEALKVQPESLEQMTRMTEILERVAALFSAPTTSIKDPETGKVMLQCEGVVPTGMSLVPGRINHLTMSPDCALALCYSPDRESEDDCTATSLVRIGSFDGGVPSEAESSVRVISGLGRGADFSPDSRRLAIGQKTLKIFGIENTPSELAVRELDSFEFEDWIIQEAKFAPDGKLLAVRILDQSWSVTMDMIYPEWNKLVVFDVSDDGKLSKRYEYRECEGRGKKLYEAQELLGFSADSQELSFVTRLESAQGEKLDAVRTLNAFDGDVIGDRVVGRAGKNLICCGALEGRPVWSNSDRKAGSIELKVLAPDSGDSWHSAAVQKIESSPCPQADEVRLRGFARGSSVIVEEAPLRRDEDEEQENNPGEGFSRTVHVLDGRTLSARAQFVDLSGLSSVGALENTPVSMSPDGTRLLAALPQPGAGTDGIGNTILALFEI
jgi:hypothetical protein